MIIFCQSRVKCNPAQARWTYNPLDLSTLLEGVLRARAAIICSPKLCHEQMEILNDEHCKRDLIIRCTLHWTRLHDNSAIVGAINKEGPIATQVVGFNRLCNAVW